MLLLLSFNEQNTIKPISLNNEDRYNQIATEVESLELDKLLGYAFYQAVAANPENYTDLLNGCSFVDDCGNTVSHRGLLYVLAYLNFARYIGESNIFDTFSGFVKKKLDNSDNVSTGDIKRLQLENREIAFNAFSLIRMYLNKNTTLYPLWNSLTSDKKIYKPTFYGIKKTIL
jgi:hypothetical protein